MWHAVFALTCCSLLLASGLQQYHDVPYQQVISARYVYPSSAPLATWPMVDIAGSVQGLAVANVKGITSGSTWVLTSSGLYLLANPTITSVTTLLMNDKLGISVKPGMFLASDAKHQQLVIAGAGVVYRCSEAPCRTSAIPSGVSSVAVCPNGDTWIGATSGLYSLPSGTDSFSRVSAIDAAVVAVSCGAQSQVSASIDIRVYQLIDNVWSNYLSTPMDGVLDGPITSLAFAPEGELWMGSETSVTQQTLAPEMLLVRYDGLSGLPMANITGLTVSADGAVWGSTIRGVFRYETAEKEWRYFYKARYLPGTAAAFVVADTNGGAWIADDKGLAHIYFEMWTLQQKAAHLQQYSSLFDRYGLAAGISLTEFGNPASAVKRDDDNDGLWTSMYTAAQAFRFAVTKDADAFADGWRRFTALEFLNNVTGIEGLMGRSFARFGDAVPTSWPWVNSTAYPGWVFKATASSDEVAGHMFIYPLVHDLLAQTPDEKGRAQRLLVNIARYISENGYYLVDVNGQPTQWGVWAPEKLNLDPDWGSERGVNSLQMLQFLLSAYYYTKDAYFLNRFNELRTFQYDRNLVNAKIDKPVDNNYSDDELTNLPFYMFSYLAQKLGATPDEYALKFVQWGFERQYTITLPGKPSLWNIMYGSSGAAAFDLESAIWSLQRWPTEPIDWPFDNSQRADVRMSPYPDRNLRYNTQTVNLYAPDERAASRWNGSPFDVSGNTGMSMTDPSVFLLPYWMGRYYQFIV